MKFFEKLKEQKGQGALEYAMILAIGYGSDCHCIEDGCFQSAVNALRIF